MPSPYRTSPRDNRGKRQHRYNQRSPDRVYGGQARKKVHRNYDNNYNRDSRDRYEERRQSRPTIHVSKKQQIEVKVNHPPSQLKVHFRFKPLKINPKNEQQLMKELKSHISSNVGPVEHFQKSYDSYPGYLIIELGFKYDHDASLYFSGKKGQFQVMLNKQLLNISAEPTKAFNLLLAQLDLKKKKKQSRSKSNGSRDARKSKNKKKSKSSSRSKSSSSSSRSKYSRRSHGRQNKPVRRYNQEQQRNYDNQRKRNQNERQRQQKRQPQPIKFEKNRNNYNSNGNSNQISQQHHYNKQIKQQVKKYKKLYFFGIHYSVNAKDMIQLLYNHQKGPFYSQQFLWRKMNGSVSQYLEGKFQQQQAQKLLQIGDKMQVKGHPFIIIQSQSIQNDKLLEKIAQYQVNIQFPKLIEPYHLLKGLKQCGRVIQIISNNKLNQQGRSDYFNITFNSRDDCDKLIALKKTQKGISIQSTTYEDATNIFRPNSQTELLTVEYVQDQNQGKNDKNRDKERQRQRQKDYKNRDY